MDAIVLFSETLRLDLTVRLVTQGLGEGCLQGKRFQKRKHTDVDFTRLRVLDHAQSVHSMACNFGRNLLYQTVFHIQISVKGLVIIHHLPTFDQKAITLLQTNKQTKWIRFLQTELPTMVSTTSPSGFTTETFAHNLYA